MVVIYPFEPIPPILWIASGWCLITRRSVDTGRSAYSGTAVHQTRFGLITRTSKRSSVSHVQPEAKSFLKSNLRTFLRG